MMKYPPYVTGTREIVIPSWFPEICQKNDLSPRESLYLLWHSMSPSDQKRTEAFLYPMAPATKTRVIRRLRKKGLL